MSATDDLSPRRFFHGTKANLKPGDLIEPGDPPDYGQQDRTTTYVYLTSSLMRLPGTRSWPSAKVPAGSTQWNRPARSWMTPI